MVARHICQPGDAYRTDNCIQVDIKITPGAHSTEAAVNKQLNDKERVAAALENPNLSEMVRKCLKSTNASA